MNNKVTYDGSKIKVVHLEKDVGSVEATALNIVNSALASTNGDLQTVKKVFEFAVFLINLLELNSSEEEEKNNEEAKKVTRVGGYLPFPVGFHTLTSKGK